MTLELRIKPYIQPFERKLAILEVTALARSTPRVAPAPAPFTQPVIVEPKIEVVYTDAPRIEAQRTLDEIRARYAHAPLVN